MCIAKKRIWFEAHLRYRFLKFQAPSQLQQVIVTWLTYKIVNFELAFEV